MLFGKYVTVSHNYWYFNSDLVLDLYQNKHGNLFWFDIEKRIGCKVKSKQFLSSIIWYQTFFKKKKSLPFFLDLKNGKITFRTRLDEYYCHIINQDHCCCLLHDNNTSKTILLKEYHDLHFQSLFGKWIVYNVWNLKFLKILLGIF